MTKNVGTVDRVVRALVGVITGCFGLMLVGGSPVWGYALLVMGGLLTLSSAFGFCFIYRLLGQTTCRS